MREEQFARSRADVNRIDEQRFNTIVREAEKT